jgi:hypothetical protein
MANNGLTFSLTVYIKYTIPHVRAVVADDLLQLSDMLDIWSRVY